MLPKLVFVWFLVFVPGNLGAQGVPRGTRSPLPVATHVLVEDIDVREKGAKIRLRKGTAVRLRGKELTTASPVEFRTRRVATDKLAKVVARDLQLDPHTKLLKGARVRVLKRKGSKVQAVPLGPLAPKLWLPADGLLAKGPEFVRTDYPSGTLSKGVELRAEAGDKAKAVVRLPADVLLVRGQMTGKWLSVTTWGPVRMQGYIPAAAWRELGRVAAPELPDRLVPTHEVFVRAPIYAGPRGGKRLATARGGVLVMTLPTEADSDRLLIRTRGSVVLEGWIDSKFLRKVEATVWQK